MRHSCWPTWRFVETIWCLQLRGVCANWNIYDGMEWNNNSSGGGDGDAASTNLNTITIWERRLLPPIHGSCSTVSLSFPLPTFFSFIIKNNKFKNLISFFSLFVADAVAASIDWLYGRSHDRNRHTAPTSTALISPSVELEGKCLQSYFGFVRRSTRSLRMFIYFVCPLSPCSLVMPLDSFAFHLLTFVFSTFRII